MRAVSSIDTVEELELEVRREDLRDRRWARRRDKLKLALLAVAAVTAPPSIVEALRHLT